jgi:DnaJ-class molecular chaperone
LNSFQVTRACATCEGSGVRESQTGVESDCPVCDGSGDETFAVSLYETEADVREDYPKASAIAMTRWSLRGRYDL